MKLVRTAAAIALASAATVAVTLFPAGPAQADITWGFGAQPETVQTLDITWGLQAKDITWG
ncbi:hypothetical protein [Nocardioides albus]|uniref:Uncharacterized protein n=1 Tax=Nocardioides albus TaxID=1841 RepID=A0A7W5FAS4_9ACTN|nr:hypothetical protein [Nocardioides albus]MBB3091466.1 hypothetical protein [Nocardioides albus]GGU41627.1 hypothetical protein GCM10007979_46110 [Nocardioides albus]